MATVSVSFKNVKINESFTYHGRAFRKIVKSNGKLGAIEIATDQLYPDCSHWYECYVWRTEKDKQKIDSSNRTTYRVVNNSDGELYGIIALTFAQERLLQWLKENDYICGDITIERGGTPIVEEI